jgi:hypothetical protein
MDTAKYLRTHRRVVEKGWRPLVSLGASFRDQKRRAALLSYPKRLAERDPELYDLLYRAHTGQPPPRVKT